MTLSSVVESEVDDWTFCRDSLFEVSRTFSQPIQLLPEEQERALTVGYLLCRVADTIEDCTGLTCRERDRLYSLFHDVMRGDTAPAELSRRFIDVNAADAELRLVRDLHRVMKVFATQKPAVRASTIRWVSEMTDGMRLYSRRAEGREFSAVYSLDDLERYCYFVAGTVGHLITELFDATIGKPGLEAHLRDECESFGLGLQMVNIVKDVTDDYSRGVCYMPRQLCRREGFEPEDLLAPQNRQGAHRVALTIADRAAEHLDAALEYTLKIPAEHHQLRLFCLLPLWMAVETLNLARHNDAIFTPGAPVKISRETVGRIIGECGRICRDDAALRARYQEMTEPTRRERGVSSAVTPSPSN